MSLVGLRAAALAAALLLAVLSRGDVIVLGALLAVGTWRPLPAVAVVSALARDRLAVDSTALEDVAGAQAVLGPGGLVDPPAAAAAAWLGALAIVLATPSLVEARGGDLASLAGFDPAPAAEPKDAGFVFSRDGWEVLVLRWLPPLAFGATAALVVAGTPIGGDVWVGVAAAVVATAVAAWIRPRAERFDRRRPLRWRRRPRPAQTLLDRAAVGLGLASLVAAAIGANPLDDVLDADALIEGVAVGLAAGGLAWAAGAVVTNHHRARATA